MTFSKVVFVLTMFVFLAACSVDSHKDKDSMGVANDFSRTSGTNFNLDALTVVRSDLADYNSYGLPKKKQFVFKTCILDNTGAAAVPNLVFRISDGAGSVLERATDIKGCIYWSEAHAFSYLKDETYFKLSRIITAKSVYRGSVTITVAFNPWADGQAAVIDPRNTDLMGNAKVVDLGNLPIIHGSSLNSSGTSSLNVNVDVANFDFDGLDYPNYEINPSLDLKIAHKYLIRFKPTVVRKTLSKTAIPESLIGGDLNVYMVIFREQPDRNKQFLPENVVSVNNFTVSDPKHVGTFSSVISDPQHLGMFSPLTTLKFDSVVDLTSRSIALLTFVPAGADSDGLGEFSFAAIVKPGRLSTMNMVPSNFNARVIAQQAADLAKTHPPILPFKKFIAENNAQSMNLAPVQVSTGFGGKKTVDLAAGVIAFQQNPAKVLPADVKREICWQMLSGQGHQQEANSICMGNLDALDYERREFAEEVVGAPTKVGVTTLTTLKTSLSFADEASVATTIGGKLSAGVAGSLTGGFQTPTSPLMPKWASAGLGLKLSLGAELNAVIEAKDVKTMKQSSTVSEDASVTAEGNVFHIKVKSRACVIASLNPKMNATNLYPKLNVKPLYSCASSTVTKETNESYYLMGQTLGTASSPFSDSDGNSETGWRMLIRGQKNALAVENYLGQHPYMQFVLHHIPGAGMNTNLTVQEAPGILSE